MARQNSKTFKMVLEEHILQDLAVIITGNYLQQQLRNVKQGLHGKKCQNSYKVMKTWQDKILQVKRRNVCSKRL